MGESGARVGNAQLRPMAGQGNRESTQPLFMFTASLIFCQKMLTSMKVLKSFTIFQLFTRTFQELHLFPGRRVTRAPSGLSVPDRSVHRAPGTCPGELPGARGGPCRPAGATRAGREAGQTATLAGGPPGALHGGSEAVGPRPRVGQPGDSWCRQLCGQPEVGGGSRQRPRDHSLSHTAAPRPPEHSTRLPKAKGEPGPQPTKTIPWGGSGECWSQRQQSLKTHRTSGEVDTEVPAQAKLKSGHALLCRVADVASLVVRPADGLASVCTGSAGGGDDPLSRGCFYSSSHTFYSLTDHQPFTPWPDFQCSCSNCAD